KIGQNVDREMVEYILDMVKPDYVQCDCKGHAGFSSYPTKVGNQAPGFIRDPLKIWRQVTAERGVSLYVHYSGVWDAKAVEKFPEWARINEQGRPDKRLTSVFGPYVDELLLPQLKELSGEYGIDGAWIDGECWATERDYHPRVLEQFAKLTGIQTNPLSPADPYWFEFSEFCRDGFRKYLDHYVSEMQKYDPDFEIASNWAYSSMMPEPVKIDVDFISGDFSAQSSLNSARFEGRCMVHQGKPWDLMAWSFTWTDGLYSTKTVPQLQQEAAVVLALGGGFQGYFPQKRDGSIRKWQMPLMAETAKFCRQRQEICHRAKPVPQIGLILSTDAFYRKLGKLFAAWSGELAPINGILQCLLDGQNVVDIVMEHHLESTINQYPLLIYPEWETLEPDFKVQLIQYVNDGGNLLVIGPKAAALFEQELDVALLDTSSVKVNGLACKDWIAGIKSMSQRVKLGESVKPFGRIYQQNDTAEDYEPAASIRPLGKGQIAAVYLNLGERYENASTTVSRDFLDELVQQLFPEPMVTVTGSHHVDVCVNRKGNRTAVHLVNTSGPHGNKQVYVFDEIPAVGPLDISIRTLQKPDSVWLEPGHRSCDYKFIDYSIKLVVDELQIHDIIVFENE
ncbi:hypothetical protein JW935_03500, partial [candidate division KSB1 bacterium]|nr:hypothetical protein [candidate division KSB1 bacterium]